MMYTPQYRDDIKALVALINERGATGWLREYHAAYDEVENRIWRALPLQDLTIDQFVEICTLLRNGFDQATGRADPHLQYYNWVSRGLSALRQPPDYSRTSPQYDANERRVMGEAFARFAIAFERWRRMCVGMNSRPLTPRKAALYSVSDFDVLATADFMEPESYGHKHRISVARRLTDTILFKSDGFGREYNAELFLRMYELCDCIGWRTNVYGDTLEMSDLYYSPNDHESWERDSVLHDLEAAYDFFESSCDQIRMNMRLWDCLATKERRDLLVRPPPSWRTDLTEEDRRQMRENDLAAVEESLEREWREFERSDLLAPSKVCGFKTFDPGYMKDHLRVHGIVWDEMDLKHKGLGFSIHEAFDDYVEAIKDALTDEYADLGVALEDAATPLSEEYRRWWEDPNQEDMPSSAYVKLYENFIAQLKVVAGKMYKQDRVLNRKRKDVYEYMKQYVEEKEIYDEFKNELLSVVGADDGMLQFAVICDILTRAIGVACESHDPFVLSYSWFKFALKCISRSPKCFNDEVRKQVGPQGYDDVEMAQVVNSFTPFAEALLRWNWTTFPVDRTDSQECIKRIFDRDVNTHLSEKCQEILFQYNQSLREYVFRDDFFLEIEGMVEECPDKRFDSALKSLFEEAQRRMYAENVDRVRMERLAELPTIFTREFMNECMDLVVVGNVAYQGKFIPQLAAFQKVDVTPAEKLQGRLAVLLAYMIFNVGRSLRLFFLGETDNLSDIVVRCEATESGYDLIALLKGYCNAISSGDIDSQKHALLTDRIFDCLVALSRALQIIGKYLDGKVLTDEMGCELFVQYAKSVLHMKTASRRMKEKTKLLKMLDGFEAMWRLLISRLPESKEGRRDNFGSWAQHMLEEYYDRNPELLKCPCQRGDRRPIVDLPDERYDDLEDYLAVWSAMPPSTLRFSAVCGILETAALRATEGLLDCSLSVRDMLMCGFGLLTCHPKKGGPVSIRRLKFSDSEKKMMATSFSDMATAFLRWRDAVVSAKPAGGKEVASYDRFVRELPEVLSEASDCAIDILFDAPEAKGHDGFNEPLCYRLYELVSHPGSKGQDTSKLQKKASEVLEELTKAYETGDDEKIFATMSAAHKRYMGTEIVRGCYVSHPICKIKELEAQDAKSSKKKAPSRHYPTRAPITQDRAAQITGLSKSTIRRLIKDPKNTKFPTLFVEEEVLVRWAAQYDIEKLRRALANRIKHPIPVSALSPEQKRKLGID